MPEEPSDETEPDPIDVEPTDNSSGSFVDLNRPSRPKTSTANAGPRTPPSRCDRSKPALNGPTFSSQTARH